MSLTFVRSVYDALVHQDRPMSIRDIGRVCGIGSTSTVRRTLAALIDRGLIAVYGPTRGYRVVRLVGPYRSAPADGLIRIPWIGTVTEDGFLVDQVRLAVGDCIDIPAMAGVDPSHLVAVSAASSWPLACITTGDILIGRIHQPFPPPIDATIWASIAGKPGVIGKVVSVHDRGILLAPDRTGRSSIMSIARSSLLSWYHILHVLRALE